MRDFPGLRSAQYRSEEIIVDRAYQRKLVWTLGEKQKLIDSVINQFPIPLILFAEDKGDNSRIFILDGMQRLDALFGFIENRFPTHDGRFFNVEEFARAKDYHKKGIFDVVANDAQKLDRATCAIVLDYVIPVSIIKNASEAEIIEVFSRINSYGRQLSEQERRQAGLRSAFSEAVRDIACEVRGDTSPKRLPLTKMPSISIETASGQLGHGVPAGQVFWVEQRILRSTELRDSMDEHVIADTLACSLLGTPMERSKEALDLAYKPGSDLANEIDAKLTARTPARAIDEYKYIISEIQKIVAASSGEHLREILFTSDQTNPFPSVFAALYLALYELYFQKKKATIDYAGVAKCLEGIAEKVKIGQTGRKPDERKKNINTIIGNIEPHFKGSLDVDAVYASPTSIDILNLLTSSQTENAVLEIKQGILRLDGSFKRDDDFLQKVPQVICGIANITAFPAGFVIFGVTDDEKTAAQIKKLYGTDPLVIGKFRVIGVDCQYEKSGLKPEQYLNSIRDAIKNSGLSEGVKKDVMESMFSVGFKDRDVICVKVSRSNKTEFVGDRCYVRKLNETVEATSKEVADLAALKAKIKA